MQVSQQHIAQTIVDQQEPTLHPALAAEIVAENYIVLDRALPDHYGFDFTFSEANARVYSGNASVPVLINDASIIEYERQARLHLFLHQKATELREKWNQKETTRIARILHTTSEIGWEDCLEQAGELLAMGVHFPHFPEKTDTPEI